MASAPALPFGGSRLTNALFGLALASLVLGALAGFFSLYRLARDRWALVHTQRVQISLETLLSTAINAETGQRGFLLTGAPQYLEPYVRAIGSVDSSFRQLDSLVADDPGQVARLATLRNTVSQKVAELRQTVQLMQQGDGVGALAMVRSEGGRILMDQARTTVTAMEGEENRQVALRTGAVLRSQRVLYLTIGLTSAIGILLLGVALATARRQRQRDLRAAEVLADQRERLRTTLASIGDGVITTDERGLITGLNPVAEQLTRWPVHDARGRHIDAVFRIIDRYSREPVVSPALRALNEGVVVGLANSVLLVTRDGTEIPMDDSAAPIRCAENKIVGCVLVFRDVTERQATRDRLREAHTRLESTLAVGEVGTWEFDVATGKISCDSNCAKLVGALPSEIAGMQMGSFTRGIEQADRRAMEEAFGHSLATGEPFEVTHRIGGAPGQDRWVTLRGRVERDSHGKVVRLPGVVVDVTAQRKSEERVRALLEASAAAESKFRAFFEQGDLFAGIMALDGTILETNRLAWEACGYSPEQIKGRKFWDGPWWAPSPLLQQMIREASALAARGEPFRAEMPYFVAGPHERMVDIRITPIRNAAGDIAFLAPTGTDITDRRRAEADRDKLVSVAENSTDFIAMYDENFVPVYVNQAGLAMVGLADTAEAERTPLQEFFFPEDQALVRTELLPAIRTAGQGEIEVRFRHFRTGQPLWMLYRLFTLFDAAGNRIGYATVSRDVSERKALEEELRALASNLSEIDRRKDEFLATLAHELRNPLAPIRNGLEIMRLSGQDSLRAEQARTMMARQLQQMVHLVDDLLDVNRISSGKMDLRTEDVELAEVLLNAVETSRPILEAKGQELVVDIPADRLLVHADVTRLVQVFANLLNNAAKYSEPGSRVVLSARPNGPQVIVTVTDSGAGIPREMLPRIFDMFMQVDRTQEHSQGGLGIGLTIVKRLVEMHGGAVEARSEGKGTGSEFQVRLPVLATDGNGQRRHALDGSVNGS